MCAAAKNLEKFTKNPILEVQGCLRSSMLIPLKRWSLVLVMISSMFVPICNCFHARRANRVKNIFLGNTPHSHSRSRGTLLLCGMKFCHKILDTLSYHMVKTRSLYLIPAWIGTRTWQTPRWAQLPQLIHALG